MWIYIYIYIYGDLTIISPTMISTNIQFQKTTIEFLGISFKIKGFSEIIVGEIIVNAPYTQNGLIGLLSMWAVSDLFTWFDRKTISF